MNILWPYDPFLRDAKLDKIGKDILLNFFPNDKIEAVYVASEAEVELSYAYNIPERYQFNLYPRNLIEKQLLKLKLKNTKVKVLKSDFISTSKMTGDLITYAKNSKTDLVVLASNAKKDIPKFIFGSFAETFLHLSKTDTLVFNQKSSFLDQRPKKILYAHDFTLRGSKGLLKAAAYAQKWDATLYVHHLPVQVPELTDEDFVFSLENNLRKCEHLLQKMKVKFVIKNLIDDLTRDDYTVAESILHYAVKNRIDIITMTTQASKLERVLGGSVSRQVLRESKKPVLIFKI